MYVVGAPIEKPSSTNDTHIASYKTEFGIVDQRREAAEILAVGGDIDTNYSSRLLLAAHWGDTTEQLAAVGYPTFELGRRLVNAAGEAVAIVQCGSGVDITSEDDYVEGETIVDFGVIDKVGLDHAFGGNPKPEGRGLSAEWLESAIEPPFIIWGSRLLLTRCTRVTLDVLGDLEVAPDSKKPVLYYRGAASLAADRELYQATRQTRSAEVHVGESALQLVHGMMHKTADEDKRKWADVTPISPL